MDNKLLLILGIVLLLTIAGGGSIFDTGEKCVTLTQSAYNTEQQECGDSDNIQINVKYRQNRGT